MTRKLRIEPWLAASRLATSRACISRLVTKPEPRRRRGHSEGSNDVKQRRLRLNSAHSATLRSSFSSLSFLGLRGFVWVIAAFWGCAEACRRISSSRWTEHRRAQVERRRARCGSESSRGCQHRAHGGSHVGPADRHDDRRVAHPCAQVRLVDAGVFASGEAGHGEGCGVTCWCRRCADRCRRWIAGGWQWIGRRWCGSGSGKRWLGLQQRCSGGTQSRAGREQCRNAGAQSRAGGCTTGVDGGVGRGSVVAELVR